MTILVVGSTGQLARHLRDLLPHALFLGRADADLSDAAMLERVVLATQPSCIVNAAAYTAVDRAESERALAWSINAVAPAVLARIADTLSVPFVHVSTDYVFGGNGDKPWRAEDPLNPLNTYGRTKLAGEMAVQTLGARHWILRTSWVFSEYGANFVKTMLRLAGERPELRVVDDQRGQPTYAGDLARLIVALVSDPDAVKWFGYGVHHATGGPAVSWKEFAAAIIGSGHRAGLLPRAVPVRGISTVDYPTPAKRPANSVLEPSPSLTAQGAPRFDWQAGLENTIARLRNVAA